MFLTVSQHRILRRTEHAIRVSDPRLAALLGIFSRLNHDEEMPGTERLQARRRLNLRFPPCRSAARREPCARPGNRFVAALSLLLVAALISGLVIAGGSARSAQCAGPAAAAARHRANVRACRPPAQIRFIPIH